jgi:hypothetical protein
MHSRACQKGIIPVRIHSARVRAPAGSGILLKVTVLLAAFAWLAGMTFAASPARAATVTHIGVPYIKPGMHPGETIAKFRWGTPVNPALPAQLSYQGGICNSASYCLNRTNGGGDIQVWANTPGGAANSTWDVNYIGTVSETAEWPFSPASGLNAVYNGQNVVNIEYIELCIYDGPGPGTELYSQINLQTCSGTTSDNHDTWVVWADSERIKGVYASNNASESTSGSSIVIQVITDGDGGYGNGSTVGWAPWSQEWAPIQNWYVKTQLA